MPFDIIQHRGDPKEATTKQNVTVYRRASFFTEEYGMVKCTIYGEHFLYENPDKSKGSISFMCTCGSAAVIANPYNTGKAFVCLHHATYGFHQTSQVNKAEWEQGRPTIRKGRKWA